MGLIPSLKMASSGEQPTAHGERGQLGGLHKMRQPHLSRKMIIDVRKYLPAMQRKSAQMVIKQELDSLHDKLIGLHQPKVDKDAVLHEALAQVEELQKLVSKL
tara:strand:+ start:313 stop:621 length:309 start_codon:yes stop_codon:yes gene_type:complete